MKTNKFYSWPAKIIVVVILILSLAVTGAAGVIVISGCATLSSTPAQLSHTGRAYEQTDVASANLASSATHIIELLSQNKLYETGGTYDENATIDISNQSAGISNAEKNENLTYSLKDLAAFYGTEEYVKLDYLVNNISSYVLDEEQVRMYLEEQAGGYDNGESATDTATDAEAATDTAATVEEITEDTAVPMDSMYLESDDTDGYSSSQIEAQFDAYTTEYATLYHNAGPLEASAGILPASGKTIAEYAAANKEDTKVSILDGYKNLLTATQSINEYLTQDIDAATSTSPVTNVVVYLKNLDTNEVLTNVEDWNAMSLSKIQSAYSQAIKDNKTRRQSELYIEAESGKATVFPEWLDGNTGKIATLTQIKNYVENTIFDGAGTNYQLFAGIASYEVEDGFSIANAYYDQFIGNVNIYFMIGAAIAGLILAIVMIILLCFQTGHIKEDKEIHPALEDHFPIEIMMFIDILVWIGLCALCFVVVEYAIPSMIASEYIPGIATSDTILTSASELMTRTIIAAGLAAAVGGCVAIYLAWTFKRYVRRIKEHSIGGSIIAGIYRVGRKTAKIYRQNKKANQRMTAGYLGFIIISVLLFIFCMACGFNGAGPVAFGFVVIEILFWVYVYRRLLKRSNGCQRIKDAIHEMQDGNLDFEIDRTDLAEDMSEIAEELSHVQEGVKRAVEVQMKSERLKTDLITNVSHDIKTPLTSIINYVDILKREQIEDEKIAGYIEVLDRKSQRLKQLTDDLVEASKISSGNISLQMQRMNLKQLIKQTNGEFEEKFEERNLEVVLNLPEGQMFIYADGRRMFRVIENLYHNAAKYSMPHSRVYVDGEVTGGKVKFSIKNMSENPLNFSASELMERFVRGDVSRNTEGSGLGLEIAKNLTEMQHGEFDLYVDGDLFKVTVTFAEQSEVVE